MLEMVVCLVCAVALCTWASLYAIKVKARLDAEAATDREMDRLVCRDDLIKWEELFG